MNNGCYGKTCITCTHYYCACNDDYDFCYEIAPKNVLLERLKNPYLEKSYRELNEIRYAIMIHYGHEKEE